MLRKACDKSLCLSLESQNKAKIENGIISLLFREKERKKKEDDFCSS